MSNMTAQEARRVLNLFKQLAEEGTCYSEALGMGISALQASIPHALTLDEARALELHAAVYAEYKLYGSIQGPFALGEILPKPDVEWPQYGRTVRWWTAWPDEELRAATPWEAKE